MRFRKKPVVIDAEHFVDIPKKRGQMFMQWPVQWSPDGKPYIVIDTLEGFHRADEGDWIIKGVKGEFYPCKPDIFEATYEAVE